MNIDQRLALLEKRLGTKDNPAILEILKLQFSYLPDTELMQLAKTCKTPTDAINKITDTWGLEV